MHHHSKSPVHALRGGANGPDRWRGRTPTALVEWQGPTPATALRVTQDADCYDVTLESFALPAPAFSAEADHRRVYIFIDESCIVLAFEQAIDPSGACGEYANGLLHLTLPMAQRLLRHRRHATHVEDRTVLVAPNRP